MQRIGFALAVLAATALVACGGQRSVERVEAGQRTGVSGKWDDTDARETAQKLIAQCVDAPWLAAFADEEGRRPAIRVREIVNKTAEHIDAQVFIKSIERAMLSSGKIKVLAQEGAELESVAAEQERGASGAVSDESAPALGNETGADFVVSVRMMGDVNQVEGHKVRYYKVDFEFISPTTGEKACIGDHEIKKVITQGAVGF